MSCSVIDGRNRNCNHLDFSHHKFKSVNGTMIGLIDGELTGMISVQVPTSLCMQNELIIHSRYCFVEQYVYPREPNKYMGNLYLRDE